MYETHAPLQQLRNQMSKRICVARRSDSLLQASLARTGTDRPGMQVCMRFITRTIRRRQKEIQTKKNEQRRIKTGRKV
mgnify:CR=1 FL=1